jgi:integrase
MTNNEKPPPGRARTSGLFRRRPGGPWHVEVEWRGFPRLRLSTGTTNKSRALAMMRTLHALRDAGRRDILGLLSGSDGDRKRTAKLRLQDVHDDFLRDPASLSRHLAKAQNPELGPLVDRWLAWLESPAALSAKTKRPFAPRTIERYGQSWQRFFALLPQGRQAKLDDLTEGFLSSFRVDRKKAGAAPATVNRDLCALSAFWSWCAAKEGLVVKRVEVPKEEEPHGRERWLSADEIAALKNALPAEWWPFFALLIYTGLRYGEAAGLPWGDVRLAERRITISSRARRLKTKASNRDVPIPEPLAQLLAEHRVRFPGGPADPVFPPPFDTHQRARAVYRRACLAAQLHDGGRNPSGIPAPNCTIHDLRHTFGVHCAQAGVPIVRLQKLLGHATPAMTLRYMRHAPESYFAEDAAKVAASLSGARNREAEAQAQLVREGLRRA